MEAEVAGYRATINGLVDRIQALIEDKSVPMKKSAIGLLAMNQRNFKSSVSEWEEEKAEGSEDTTLLKQYEESVRTAFTRYRDKLHSVLGLPPVTTEPPSLYV